MMRHLRTFTVIPSLPSELIRLRELAHNLWWSWTGEARDLFRRLDPELWDGAPENPVRFLAHVPQKKLDAAAKDRAYLAHMQRVLEKFDAYLGAEPWFATAHPDLRDARIAYFSMEFGLHESLPIYSGGLGILAGDHLKSASDLGVPLVGVGLLYRHGYFQQRISTDGWQVEDYPPLDFFQAPLTPLNAPDGKRLSVTLPIGERSVTAHVWRAQVGRVFLFLLDADIPENDPRDRELTHRLYGGDSEMRIRQEILLGIGGLRALRCAGVHPDVCHMNEGHAAFLALESIAQRREEGQMSFAEAREAVTAGLVFTTHTPVPAGIDHFEDALLEKYLTPYLPAIGLTLVDLLALGKVDPADPKSEFSMAVLALRLAGAANGVSALHGHVSREMWHTVWPGAPKDEIPITSITNGIHTNTWISPEMADLMDRYLGPAWAEPPVNQEVWNRVEEIPDIELWRTHERRRLALVAFARQRLKQQLRRRGATPPEIKAAEEVLDPEALTIGFARRFAPYKRGALLFKNIERLAAIVSSEDRPVQFIFAGKAHPRDDKGKAVIKEIFAAIRNPALKRHVVFLENYDIAVGRMLVQGCDVWLNNPIKPREASGTSGMKLPPNGGINFSVLDGWWPEAYDGENGWAIEGGRVYDDVEYRDHVESEAIYDLLEKEIAPLFFERGADGLPRGWIKKMKASMRTICPLFSTHRMLEEYANLMYAPAARRWRRASADNFAAARALARWRQELAERWPEISIESVEANDDRELPVGATIQVQARIRLGEVKPDQIAVELYHGRMDGNGQLAQGSVAPMTCRDPLEEGLFLYGGEIPCQRSGQHAYAIRVIPRHDDLSHRYQTGLIAWG